MAEKKGKDILNELTPSKVESIKRQMSWNKKLFICIVLLVLLIAILCWNWGYIQGFSQGKQETIQNVERLFECIPKSSLPIVQEELPTGLYIR